MNHTVENLISNHDKPSFWLLHTLGWAAYVLIFTVDNVFFYRDFNKLGFYVVYPLIIGGLSAALLTWPLRYIYSECWKLSPVKLILAILFSSLVVSFIWTPLKNLAMWYFYEDFNVLALLKGDVPADFKFYMLLMSVSYSFFMILVWSSLYFGINYHFRLVNEKQLHLDAVRLSHRAQIKMLRYQINPHFLFNTLNAISTLVLNGSKDKANGMLTRLSTFLRFSLDNDPEKKIRLYDELKALMLYLEIEKTRFDDRLSIKFHVEAKAEPLLVPSLLLQPLVENSIKFAIAQMSSGGVIEISARCANNLLHLEVADNGPGDNSSHVVSPEQSVESEHKGVGIQNIIDRLSVLYPGNHDFSISRNIPRGHKVSITIPMEEK